MYPLAPASTAASRIRMVRASLASARCSRKLLASRVERRIAREEHVETRRSAYPAYGKRMRLVGPGATLCRPGRAVLAVPALGRLADELVADGEGRRFQ